MPGMCGLECMIYIMEKIESGKMNETENKQGRPWSAKQARVRVIALLSPRTSRCTGLRFWDVLETRCLEKEAISLW